MTGHVDLEAINHESLNAVFHSLVWKYDITFKQAAYIFNIHLNRTAFLRLRSKDQVNLLQPRRHNDAEIAYHRRRQGRPGMNVAEPTSDNGAVEIYLFL